jgi:hypothetical protein
MARHSFRKSPRAHGMKLYMFVQLLANLCITDWSSGLVCWESFIKLLCLHAYSLYATCRRGSLNFTVTEFDDYYVAFGNSNAHEMKVDGSTTYSFRIQVYMTVNKSTWELTHVICFAMLHTSLDWDAGWQRRGIPAGWGIFQNKRNPDLYLAHQYCGYFCARFPSAWRCIAWFILFEMQNLNVHWWMGTFAGCLCHCPNPSGC